MTTPRTMLESPRLRLACIGAFGMLVLVGAQWLHRMALPWDGTYQRVLYLMWHSTPGAVSTVTVTFALLKVAAAVACMIALTCALLSGCAGSKWALQLGVSGIVLALWFTVSADLGRVSSNALYAVVRPPDWRLTEFIAKLETPLLVGIQAAALRLNASALVSWAYSAIWLLGVIGAVPLCLLSSDNRLAFLIIGAVVVTTIVALPVFALLPVFDPWALSLHTNGRFVVGEVQLLAIRADVQALRVLLRDTPWSAGAAFPSLHVAFPAVIGMVLRQRVVRVRGALYLTLAGVTSAVVVVLGRHWIVDVIGGWLLAWMIAGVFKRLAGS